MRRRIRREYDLALRRLVLSGGSPVHVRRQPGDPGARRQQPAAGDLHRGRDLSGILEGAGGIGGLLARTDHSTLNPQLSTAFYHADGNGNITALINTNPIIVAKYLYDPYGNIPGPERAIG